MKQRLLIVALLPIVALATGTATSARVLAAPAPATAERSDEDATGIPAPGTRTIISAGSRGVLGPDGELVETSTDVRRIEAPPPRAVTFQIPDFRPGHANDRRYYVVEFSGRSNNIAPAAASADGLLTANFADLREQQADLPQPPAGEAGSWFLSVHNDTRQLLITLDLADVALTALVDSLAAALNRSAQEQELQRAGVQNRVRGEPAGNVRLKIRGNHMTLRETFDLIYQQTGCEIFREQGRLLVTVCE